MPTSARKSSIGLNRRGPQKYVPYRGDDLQHGKRTGIAVGYIEHDSDDFEPFDAVMRQADMKTPPKPKVQGKRKRLAKTPVVQEEDEDGEMSMELDDSNPNSPAAYFASTRVNTITSSVQRVGSSSRPVQQRSNIDFDSVPSPRNASSAYSRRAPAAKGPSAGPSHLSRSAVRQDMDDDDSDAGGFGDIPFDAGYDDGNLPPSDPESDSDRTPVPKGRQSLGFRRSSFMEIGQEDPQDEDEQMQEEEQEEEEEQQVERHVSGKQAKGKGKGKSRHVEEPEPEVEDEIALGLDEVEQQPDEEFGDDFGDDNPEEEEQVEPSPRGKTRKRDADDSTEKQRPKKKTRAEDDGAEKPKKPRGRPRKENVLREVVHDQNVDENGLRRGSRLRYKPLDWWRCEKVVYGRRESGQQFVPTIKEILRVPQEEVKPLGAKHKRRRQKSKTVEPEPPLVYNPEEGWDDKTDTRGIVLHYPSGAEVEKRLACTAKMLNPKPAANANFLFQKVFGDGNFMAAGQLVIPPGGSKPTKSTKDNTFVFYVIEGGVNFKVHRTSFLLTTGAMFLVPRGNMYIIQNVSERPAKLFFAQARKVQVEEVDDKREDRSPTFVNPT